MLRRDALPAICRYDVKYGSAGFSSWGYKAGCVFITANPFSQELTDQDSPAGQYFCRGAATTGGCFHDHSGSGLCASLGSQGPVTIGPSGQPFGDGLNVITTPKVRVHGMVCNYAMEHAWHRLHHASAQECICL